MFSSHGKLYCLNSDSAKLWEFDTLGPINGSQALTPGSGGGGYGLNSTPVVANQFTFVAGCDKPFLRIVDVSSGQQHAEIPLESLMIASPALIGNVLYFGTPDGEVIALDWSTKQQQWLYADKQRTQEIHSSPAVTDQLVLIGSRDKRLHGSIGSGKALDVRNARPIDPSRSSASESAGRSPRLRGRFQRPGALKHNADIHFGVPAVGDGPRHRLRSSDGKILLDQALSVEL
jgi:outer membrane protein assembly factor BamB